MYIEDLTVYAALPLTKCCLFYTMFSVYKMSFFLGLILMLQQNFERSTPAKPIGTNKQN